MLFKSTYGLAKKGTYMEAFQKTRTRAFTRLMDSKDEHGIYKSTEFFSSLDYCVDGLIKKTHREAIDSLVAAVEKILLKDIGSDSRDDADGLRRDIFQVIEKYSIRSKQQ
jgi:hypothetical protein